MAQFVKVADLSDLAPGTCKTVQANGKAVALFNVGGTVYAVDNTCLHRGGPLGEGILDAEVVTCPWHGWQYDVTTGKVTVNPEVGVQVYPIELRGDDIFVDCG